METATFILAAGTHSRWKNTIKQLLPIGGKPIILRTLLLLEEYFHPVYVVTHEPQIKRACSEKAKIIKPDNNNCVLNSLGSTKELWPEKVIVLLGDVVYSPCCLKAMHDCQDEFMFFGSKVEIFGMAICGRQAQHRTLADINETVARMGIGEFGAKFWYLYQYMHGKEPNVHSRYEGGNFYLIEDYTKDVDRIEDYKRFLQENEWARND